MTAKRYGHTTTLLPDGRVLLAGGNASLVAELYDPSQRTFAPTGSMTVVRLEHLATLLTNGEVLLAGGHENHYVGLAVAELYY
jgi:hypothetical protein